MPTIIAMTAAAAWCFAGAAWVLAAFIRSEYMGQVAGCMGHKWRKVRGKWQWQQDDNQFTEHNNYWRTQP